MTPPIAARDSVAEALRSLGLTDEPEKFDDGIHSWRCSHPDVYGRCACFADAVSDILSAIDWRVLGGLVPGVIVAAWLRIGDRVRIAATEGVVISHTVRTEEDVALFVVRTDRGAEIACERWTGSEVLVVSAGVNRG